MIRVIKRVKICTKKKTVFFKFFVLMMRRQPRSTRFPYKTKIKKKRKQEKKEKKVRQSEKKKPKQIGRAHV